MEEDSLGRGKSRGRSHRRCGHGGKLRPTARLHPPPPISSQATCRFGGGSPRGTRGPHRLASRGGAERRWSTQRTEASCTTSGAERRCERRASRKWKKTYRLSRGPPSVDCFLCFSTRFSISIVETLTSQRKRKRQKKNWVLIDVEPDVLRFNVVSSGSFVNRFFPIRIEPALLIDPIRRLLTGKGIPIPELWKQSPFGFAPRTGKSVSYQLDFYIEVAEKSLNGKFIEVNYFKKW